MESLIFHKRETVPLRALEGFFVFTNNYEIGVWEKKKKEIKLKEDIGFPLE